MLTKLVILCLFSSVFGYRVILENNGTELIHVHYTALKWYPVEPQKSIHFDLTADFEYGAFHGDHPSLYESRGVVDPGGHNENISYSIYLQKAYNLPITIVPVGEENCKTLSCTANILEQCPEKNQRLDSDGKVVACLYDQELFESLCPDIKEKGTCRADLEAVKIIFG